MAVHVKENNAEVRSLEVGRRGRLYDVSHGTRGAFSIRYDQRGSTFPVLCRALRDPAKVCARYGVGLSVHPEVVSRRPCGPTAHVRYLHGPHTDTHAHRNRPYANYIPAHEPKPTTRTLVNKQLQNARAQMGDREVHSVGSNELRGGNTSVQSRFGIYVV